LSKNKPFPKPSIKYKILDVKEFLQPLPLRPKQAGDKVPMTNYAKIMADIDIKTFGLSEMPLYTKERSAQEIIIMVKEVFVDSILIMSKLFGVLPDNGIFWKLFWGKHLSCVGGNTSVNCHCSNYGLSCQCRFSFDSQWS
jgi:hypothetical protein